MAAVDLFGEPVTRQAPQGVRYKPPAKTSQPPRVAVPDPVDPIKPAESKPVDELGGRFRLTRLMMSREYAAELRGPLFDYDQLRSGLRGAVGYLTDAETMTVCKLIADYFAATKLAEHPQKASDDDTERIED